MPRQITFRYLNHKGKTETRTVDVESVEFIRDPGFGYQSGWFISGRCHDRDARRSFALSRILMDETFPPPIYRLLTL